jgi:voltage-gated potassium channel Kch
VPLELPCASFQAFEREHAKRWCFQGFAMKDRVSKPTSFDLFILALTVFSLINIVWLILPIGQQIRGVVLIVDAVCCIAFLIDFLLLFNRAPSKSAYFFGQRGWLDLLGSLPIPFLRLARIYRVMSVYVPLKRTGGEKVLRRLARDRAGSAIFLAILLTTIVLQYMSMAILWVEGDDPKANIHTSSDAVWWAYVTVATVGYGDKYPVTNEGRLVGVALMTAGVGLFAVFTGFVANVFLAPRRSASQAAQQTETSERLLRPEKLTDDHHPPKAAQELVADGETTHSGHANP